MYFNLSYCEFSSRVFIITCSGPEITNLPVKGGEASGGVGTWRIGSGGAFEAIGSVMMGMDGMRGGRESCGSGSGSGTGDPKAMTAA